MLMIEADERYVAELRCARKRGFEVGDDEIRTFTPNFTSELMDERPCVMQITEEFANRIIHIDAMVEIVVKTQARNRTDAHRTVFIARTQHFIGIVRREERDVVTMAKFFDQCPHARGMPAAFTGHAVKEFRHAVRRISC